MWFPLLEHVQSAEMENFSDPKHPKTINQWEFQDLKLEVR